VADPRADEPDPLAGAVGAQARRKLRARRGTPMWCGLGMLGLVGWSVAVPTVAGAALGLWLDARHPGGRSWTLALLVAGLLLGCANAWHWVARQQRALREEMERKDDGDD
jgi:ATP synthase protein I